MLEEIILIRIHTAKEKKELFLDLSCTGLLDKQMEEIGMLLEKSSITRLNLSRNNLSAIGAAYLAPLSLEAVNLSRNNISELHLAALHDLIKSPFLAWLDLSSNALGKDAGEILALHSQQSYLNIHANKDIPADVKGKIASRITKNPPLPENLSNPFGKIVSRYAAAETDILSSHKDPQTETEKTRPFSY